MSTFHDRKFRARFGGRWPQIPGVHRDGALVPEKKVWKITMIFPIALGLFQLVGGLEHVFFSI